MSASAAARPFMSMPGPRSFPVLGTLPYYFTGKYSFDRLHWNGLSKMREFGPAVREEVVPGVSVVWLFDPDDIRNMFSVEGTCPSRRSHLALQHYRLGRPSLYSSAGLLPTNGPAWQALRSKYQFRPEAVEAVLPQLEELASDLAVLVERADESANGDDSDPVMTALKRFFFEATNVFLFGEPFTGLRDQRTDTETAELLEATEKTNGNILKTDNGPQMWKKFETPSYRSIREGQERIERFATEMLQRHGFRLAKVTEGAEEKDLFTFVSDMLLAGVDTSAYSCAFLLYHLARNPEEQDRVRAGCGPGRLLERSTGLRRAKAALKESLRLNPISVGVGRISDSDGVFSGYNVPAGTVLVSQCQVSCRLPEYFARPDEFLPSRWDRDEKCAAADLSPHTPQLVLPFGSGRRMCVGRRLAEKSILAAVNGILTRLRLEWVAAGEGDRELDCLTRLINRPDAPLRFRAARVG